MLGNLIGTDRNGTGNLGNSGDGVLSFVDATIGGTPERANTIAFNGRAGVLHGFETARILNNFIFSNGGLGIDLTGNLGQEPNDIGDGDTGGNGLQNYPVLSSAKSGKKASIKGELGSKANQTYKLQFFSNPPNTDEGKVFLGETTVTTNSTGLATFTFKPSKAAKKLLKAGDAVTATATDSSGNTSEFSEFETVVGKKK